MTEIQPSPEAPPTPEPKRPKRLLIASPAKGGVPHAYLILLDRIKGAGGIKGWNIETAVEASQNALCLSRNILAQEARVGKFDRMLMLDLDHPVDVFHLERILSHDHDLYPIVSGLYCIKKPGEPWLLGLTKRGAKVQENKLVEAAFLPTGFLSVSVAALNQIAAFHPDREFYIQDEKAYEHVALTPVPRQTKETMTEFFPIGVNGPRSHGARFRRIKRAMETIMAKGVNSATHPQMIEALQKVVEALTDPGEPGWLTGEDYFFSLLAAQAGVKQYLDLGCLIPHRGSIDYPILSDAVVAKKMPQIPAHEGNPDEW